MNTSVEIRGGIEGLAKKKFCDEEQRTMAYLINKALETCLEDWHDYKLAEEGYQRYLNDDKQGTDLADLAKDLGIELKNYRKKNS